MLKLSLFGCTADSKEADSYVDAAAIQTQIVHDVDLVSVAGKGGV